MLTTTPVKSPSLEFDPPKVHIDDLVQFSLANLPHVVSQGALHGILGLLEQDFVLHLIELADNVVFLIIVIVGVKWWNLFVVRYSVSGTSSKVLF